MTINLFDLNNCNDIAPVLKGRRPFAWSCLRKEITWQIEELFALKNVLSISEIVAALFRKYSAQPSRRMVDNAVNNMFRRGDLTRVGRGKYRKVRSFKDRKYLLDGRVLS